MCGGLSPTEGSNPSLSVLNLSYLMIERESIFGYQVLLACVLLTTTACSRSGDNPVADKRIVMEKAVSEQIEPMEDVQLPPGISQNEGSAIKNRRQMTAAQSLINGYGDKLKNHPDFQDKKKVKRGVSVPKDVEGKWKAVKLLIKNKIDEEQNEFKTVNLGSNFTFEDLNIKVGPFLPNFVMTDISYTSMGNELDNPAVLLIIEKNGQQVYKGWAFAHFPEMYAFTHKRIGIQLMDFVSKQVS